MCYLHNYYSVDSTSLQPHTCAARCENVNFTRVKFANLLEWTALLIQKSHEFDAFYISENIKWKVTQFVVFVDFEDSICNMSFFAPYCSPRYILLGFILPHFLWSLRLVREPLRHLYLSLALSLNLARQNPFTRVCFANENLRKNLSRRGLLPATCIRTDGGVTPG